MMEGFKKSQNDKASLVAGCVEQAQGISWQGEVE
jgi:hypothetical protein